MLADDKLISRPFRSQACANSYIAVIGVAALSESDAPLGIENELPDLRALPGILLQALCSLGTSRMWQERKSKH